MDYQSKLQPLVGQLVSVSYTTQGREAWSHGQRCEHEPQPVSNIVKETLESVVEEAVTLLNAQRFASNIMTDVCKHGFTSVGQTTVKFTAEGFSCGEFRALSEQ